MENKLFTNPEYHSSLLADLRDDLHSDVVLVSDDKSVAVHSVFLGNSSKIMKNLLSSTSSKTIILPGFSSVLSDFVTLIYTGKVSCKTMHESKLLVMLCKHLGVGSRDTLKITTSIDEYEEFQIMTDFNDSDCLKVDTEMLNEDTKEMFSLRLPISRIDRRNVNTRIVSHTFQGFRGRIQKEYNTSPVGPFEGPYDQNPEVPLSAQLSKSKLSYEKYTRFTHPQSINCKRFQINENFEDIDDLRKIESMEIVEDVDEPFVNPNEDNKVHYTCTKNQCIIPCPCNQCNNTHEGQCTQHNIKHRDLFDENEDAISVRSTDNFCCRKSFFNHSYILKYPGIPRSCIMCEKDLLHHKCYHLNFHNTCKFCKFYQYKLFPTTIKELNDREVKEKNWYKSVCPYCDKKFSEPYTTRKHINMEHKNKKLKCEECPKSFQCRQSLDYHRQTAHSMIIPSSYDCDICEKGFVTKVGLSNHKKFTHTDDCEQLQCEQCEANFKHQKYLNAHMLNVHGLDKKKEDYWQDIPKNFFQCEICKTRFIRKGDLKVHFKSKHTTQEMLKCDQCTAEFKYKKNLERHKFEKHGEMDMSFKCPDCDKVFKHKRNMERHQLSHCHINT